MKTCNECHNEKELIAFSKASPSSRNKDGHIGKCKDCVNRLFREKYAKDSSLKEVRTSRAQKWREENREKKRQTDREYRTDAEVKKRRVVHQNNRRALLISTGVVDPNDWLELCNQYGNICLRCKEAKPLTMDHVIPLSKGGLNIIENIQPLCQSCNAIKGNRNSTDYRPSQST